MGISILLSESLCGGEWSLVIKLSVRKETSQQNSFALNFVIVL